MDREKENCVTILEDLIPGIYDYLAGTELLPDFVNFLKILSTQKFPLDNIAFRLLLDVSHWYSCGSTNRMTYSNQTKLFWRVGYKLFHGSFLRFMSGGKNEGRLIQEQNHLDPTLAIINFAVPDEKIIRSFNTVDIDLPPELQPGLIHQSLALKAAQTEKSFVLSLDGKKVASGLSDEFGDINLFGYEQPTLQVQLESFKGDIDKIMELIKLASGEQTDMGNKLLDAVKTVSKWIKTLREHTVMIFFVN